MPKILSSMVVLLLSAAHVQAGDPSDHVFQLLGSTAPPGGVSTLTSQYTNQSSSFAVNGLSYSLTHDPSALSIQSVDYSSGVPTGAYFVASEIYPNGVTFGLVLGFGAVSPASFSPMSGPYPLQEVTYESLPTLTGPTAICFNGDLGDPYPIDLLVSNELAEQLVLPESCFVFNNAANDLCDDAEIIAEVSSFPWSNLTASQSGANPGCGDDSIDPFDVWYEFTAVSDGQLTIDTLGSTFDTRLAVWDSCGGSVVACNDDFGGGLQSQVQIQGVSAGDTFLIQLGGYAEAQGTGSLRIQVAGSRGILLLDWASNYAFAQVAAGNLGLTPTVVVNGADFEAALSGTSWALVIVDNPSDVFVDPAPLAAYIDSGIGIVILNYWNADDPAYAAVVTDRMGAIGFTDYTVPQTLFCWDCADVAWNWVQPLTEVLPASADLWMDDGDLCDPIGTGVAVGGFMSSTPTAGQAGLIRNSPVNETFLVTAVLDGSDPIQAVQLWENMISYALTTTITCFPVSNLTAVDPDCDTDTIELSWTVNDAGTTAIELTRDGLVIATLGAGVTSFTDSGMADGVHTYSVQAFCGADPAPSASTTVQSTSIGATENIVFRLDGGGGMIDSATAIEAALDNAGQSWIEVSSLTDPLCSDANTVYWVVTGTFPDNFPLAGDTADVLVAHITSGGAVYFEGGDTWGFDSPTSFNDCDGIENGTALDGDDSFVSMDGTDGNIDTTDFIDVVYNQDQVGLDYTDQIFATATDIAGANSTVIWTEGNQLYNTGVAYQTDSPFGNVVAQSWEFGGFGGNQDDLFSRYLDFLLSGSGPSSPSFLRGDVNDDSSADIGDVIFGLSSLFVPGSSPPSCAESSDVNSDGGFDIADMIFLLSSLFIPGSPQPWAPYPSCAPAPAPTGCSVPQC